MATPGLDGKTATGYPLPYNPATAGVSYPYGVPPPQFQYSSFYQEHRPTDLQQPSSPASSLSSFLCRFFSCFIAVIGVIIVIGIIMALILKPQVPKFRVDSASVTSLNSTAQSLTARWNITLVATNPNRKMSISYDAIAAVVFYGEEGLASTRLPPFSQQTRNETAVQVQFAVVNEFVDNEVALHIGSDQASGSVEFGLTLGAWITYKVGILRSIGYLFEVQCYPLRFAFSSKNGTGALMSRFICA